MPVIKYDFKELLDKGFKDLPSNILSSNYCFHISKKLNDIVIKPYSDTSLNSADITYIDIYK